MKHAIAQIRWLPEDEGGRRAPVTTQRYMSPVAMEGLPPSAGVWTLVVNRGTADPQTEETVLVHFLMEEAPHSHLRPGTTFCLTEGAATVAEGVVSEVFELTAA